MPVQEQDTQAELAQLLEENPEEAEALLTQLAEEGHPEVLALLQQFSEEGGGEEAPIQNMALAGYDAGGRPLYYFDESKVNRNHGRFAPKASVSPSEARPDHERSANISAHVERLKKLTDQDHDDALEEADNMAGSAGTNQEIDDATDLAHAVEIIRGHATAGTVQNPHSPSNPRPAAGRVLGALSPVGGQILSADKAWDRVNAGKLPTAGQVAGMLVPGVGQARAAAGYANVSYADDPGMSEARGQIRGQLDEAMAGEPKPGYEEWLACLDHLLDGAAQSA